MGLIAVQTTDFVGGEGSFDLFWLLLVCGFQGFGFTFRFYVLVLRLFLGRMDFSGCGAVGLRGPGAWGPGCRAYERTHEIALTEEQQPAPAPQPK